MRVLLTFAVDAEFAPWRRRHRFIRKTIADSSHAAGSDVIYTCQTNENHLEVYLTGVGWKRSRAVLASLLKHKPDLCISSGLAGGLNSRLKHGEIVVARQALAVNGGQKLTSRPLLVALAEQTGATAVNAFLTNTRVVCDAKTKRSMAEFGDVVEMESIYVLKLASDVQVPAIAIRAVSDIADEDLPLDFGQTLAADGHISFGRLLLQVGRHPQKVPALIRFGNRSQHAAQNLADFLDKYVGTVRQRFPHMGAEQEAAVAMR